MDGLSDEQLIAIYADEGCSAARRDQAIDILFTRYQSRVALWCFRIAGNRDTARDLAQEVFVRALRSMPGFRGEAKFSTWLYTIARNHCFNAAKATAVRAEEPIGETDYRDELNRGVDEDLAIAGEVHQMQDLLNRTLDETERQVMTLHYGEELSLGDVTRLLGLTNVSGAKAYVVSARRKLSRVIDRMKRSGRSAQ